MWQKFSLKNALLVMMMLTCLAACIGMEASLADKQVRLKQRCEGYIEARAKSDLTAMQGYYKNPGQARLGSILYKSSEIVSLTIAVDGKLATTKLQNSIMAMGFTFDKAPQTLNWEWYNRNWYLIVKAPSASPFGDLKSKEKKSSNEQK